MPRHISRPTFNHRTDMAELASVSSKVTTVAMEVIMAAMVETIVAMVETTVDTAVILVAMSGTTVATADIIKPPIVSLRTSAVGNLSTAFVFAQCKSYLAGVDSELSQRQSAFGIF